MSRQSKALSRASLARAFNAMHARGEKGPAQTTPKHGKAAHKRHYSTASRRAPGKRAEV